MDTPPSTRRRPWAYLLLLAPFIGLLVPSWYARAEPRLSGIPFFIWYQFLWVIVAAVLTFLVYALTSEREETR